MRILHLPLWGRYLCVGAGLSKIIHQTHWFGTVAALYFVLTTPQRNGSKADSGADSTKEPQQRRSLFDSHDGGGAVHAGAVTSHARGSARWFQEARHRKVFLRNSYFSVVQVI